MFAIAGVSGQTGAIVAETLLAKGLPVRVIVRDEAKGAAWKGRGAEVAVANLEDEAALSRALRGVAGAYVLLPPDASTTDFFGSRGRMSDAIARAAADAGLAHLVLLSAMGAHLPDGHGPIGAPYRAERSLERLGIGTTFVRAAYFLESYASLLPTARQSGVMPSFLPAGFRHPVVATGDIGRTAAQALLDGPRGRRVIELSGPADVTPEEVAASMSELLGRSVKVAEVPLEAVVPAFTSMGMSPHMSEVYRNMFEGFISGRVAWEGAGEAVRGSIGVKEGLRASRPWTP